MLCWVIYLQQSLDEIQELQVLVRGVLVCVIVCVFDRA